MKALLLVLIFVRMCFPAVEVIDKIHMDITVDRKGFPCIFYIDPPCYVYEGINNEIIIPQKTFFEVFDKKGKLQGRYGNKGMGPGDFNNIMSLIVYDGRYYFHDYPNVISVFDSNFKFLERSIYGGLRTSQFMETFDIFRNKIYSVQNFRKKKREYDSISVYSMNGKYLSHFFDQSIIWKVYPELTLTNGRILVFNDHIYFSHFSIPKLYKLNLKGEKVNSIKFGEKWWKKINYSKNRFKKRVEQFGDRAYVKLLLSGDRIMKILKWENLIIVHVLKDPSEDHAKHGFVVFTKNLKKKTDFIFYKDYHFSGAGKFLYFSKESEEYDNKDKYKVEVLKCDIKF